MVNRSPLRLARKTLEMEEAERRKEKMGLTDRGYKFLNADNNEMDSAFRSNEKIRGNVAEPLNDALVELREEENESINN